MTKKPQKQWWDKSIKKKRVHSKVFLLKQEERNVDVETGMDKFSLPNRPYFMPLPDNWETHKHLNVIPMEEFLNGQSYTQQEFSVAVIGAKLEKIGYFAITPQKLKQPVIRHPFLAPIVQPKVKREEELPEEVLQALEEDDE